MKDILNQMEEHIAAIRNLQRNFDFHSKILEKLMISLTNWHIENNLDLNDEKINNFNTVDPKQSNTQ